MEDPAETERHLARTGPTHDKYQRMNDALAEVGKSAIRHAMANAVATKFANEFNDAFQKYSNGGVYVRKDGTKQSRKTKDRAAIKAARKQNNGKGKK